MRGQFFSIDVFIAAIILVSGSVVLLFSISDAADLQPAQLFGADILRETLTKSIRELNYEVLTSPTNGFANTTNPYDIEDYEKTLGEVIGEYHHLAQESVSAADVGNYTLRAGRITNLTIAPLISGQYSYRINLVNESGSRTTVSWRERIAFERAEYRVASRSIVAGVDRKDAFYGPITIEVIVWN